MKGITTRDSVGYSELPSHMGAGAGVSVLLAPFCTGGGSLPGYQLLGTSSLASTLGPGMLPSPENGLWQETWGAAGVYKTPLSGISGRTKGMGVGTDCPVPVLQVKNGEQGAQGYRTVPGRDGVEVT